MCQLRKHQLQQSKKLISGKLHLVFSYVGDSSWISECSKDADDRTQTKTRVFQIPLQIPEGGGGDHNSRVNFALRSHLT